MWHQIREVYFYREMLKNLVSKELRARYKGSVLGFLWTFFNPLLMLIVYSVVFSFIMRIETENYAMFLFVALLPWNFLSSSIMQGAASLVQNGSLIKKIYFPREILPLSIVIANLINYLLSLFILIPALIFFKIKITPAILSFSHRFVYNGTAGDVTDFTYFHCQCIFSRFRAHSQHINYSLVLSNPCIIFVGIYTGKCKVIFLHKPCHTLNRSIQECIL